MHAKARAAGRRARTTGPLEPQGMEFSKSVDISASPRRVWEVMADVERWAEWTDSVRSVKRVAQGAAGVRDTRAPGRS